jgi:DNA-binding LytR/AlgR family response regulator
MEKVREINYLGDVNYELVLSDKEETIIPLSRSRAKILRKNFGW